MLTVSCLLLAALQGPSGPVTPWRLERSPHARVRPVAASEVRIRGGFWLPRLQANRRSLAAGHRQLTENGAFANFRKAAGELPGPHRVYVFTDSDCYKWLEAACLEIGLRGGDEELRRQVDEFTALVLRAMEPDGYVMTKYQVEGTPRWSNLAHWHELYCHGHLIQAAIAHRRALGDSDFFRRVRDLADLICRTFPGEREGAPGHPEIELALVELYRETGETRYLETARYFLDRRGVAPQVAGGSPYMQDHQPLREQTEAVGHAVRAMYLFTGAADLCLETGDPSLPPLLRAVWADVGGRKTYVTGGVGARHDGEALGEAWELPNARAYSETCAAIGAMLLARRLWWLDGDLAAVDALERALYNNTLAAVSLDGESFFYVNPLETPGGTRRQPWYACACCPPNIMRTLAAVGGDLFAVAEGELLLLLPADCELDTRLPDGRRARLRVETDYPWDGRLRITPLAGNQVRRLRLRIPASSPGLRLTGPGGAVQVLPNPGHRQERGQLVAIDLDARDGFAGEILLPVEALEARPEVLEDRGRVVLRRGPLVYCFEEADNPGAPPLQATLVLDPEAPDLGWRVLHRPDLLGGVVVLQGPGTMPAAPEAGPDDAPLYRLWRGARPATREVRLTAVPYCTWANRGAGAMRIWMPVQPASTP